MRVNEGEVMRGVGEVIKGVREVRGAIRGLRDRLRVFGGVLVEMRLLRGMETLNGVNEAIGGIN